MFGGRKLTWTYLEAVDRVFIRPQAVVGSHIWLNKPNTSGFFISNALKQRMEAENMGGLEYAPCGPDLGELD